MRSAERSLNHRVAYRWAINKPGRYALATAHALLSVVWTIVVHEVTHPVSLLLGAALAVVWWLLLAQSLASNSRVQSPLVVL